MSRKEGTGIITIETWSVWTWNHPRSVSQTIHFGQRLICLKTTLSRSRSTQVDLPSSRAFTVSVLDLPLCRLVTIFTDLVQRSSLLYKTVALCWVTCTQGAVGVFKLTNGAPVVRPFASEAVALLFWQDRLGELIHVSRAESKNSYRLSL